MTRLRSGTLVAWYSAWSAGLASSDDALLATVGTDAPHVVMGLGEDTAPLSEALLALRNLGGSVRLALPVAGDVRGLPGPADFRIAALDAGEAVLGDGLGLVPEIVEHAPSSAPIEVTWQAFSIEPAPPDPLSFADAQQELTAEIREAATALSAADVAGWMDDIDEELHNARRAGERMTLPPGHPPRAVALLAQAERLHAVLEIAARDPHGGAVDRMGIAARASGLRPLATAVRRARLAGYNALADTATH
jgi:hypothetical protein